MDTNYVIIEDDSNIYYTKKKYDAYFTMKHPMIIDDENKENNDFKLNIDLKNENNNQIILISIYKYKLLDFLTKLGGIMKIITIMKMTCTFWSSYFYEKTLYKLIVKRKNPYLENNFNSNIGPFALPNKNNKNNINDEYCSYFAWIMNKFCKVIYLNKEARRKKLMITDTLGLSNYLLHLDYIDRQIILEQKTGEINKKIKEILSKSNNSDDLKDNSMDVNLNYDNTRKSSETETDDFENKKNKNPLIDD